MRARPTLRSTTRRGLRLLSACCALSLTPPAAAGTGVVTQERVDEAIARGVTHLLSTQRPDGSWLRRRNLPSMGITALITYALLKCGVASDEDSIERALAYLAHQPATQTYDTACLVLALCAQDPRTNHDWIEQLSEQLRSWQKPEGWGYPLGHDLSNTQFAALGLRAAAQAGVEVPSQLWWRLHESVSLYEHGHGSYCYEPGKPATGSMTGAAVGVLSTCRALLGRDRLMSAERARALEHEIAQALDSLGREFAGQVARAHPTWSFYYLYGLERVGAFCGVSRIGGEAWYEAGASWLLDLQQEDGSWRTPAGEEADPSDACFALLFLSRASHAAETGPEAAAHGQPSSLSSSPDAGLRLRVLLEEPLTVWVESLSASARARLEWPGQTGRGPHVVRLAYFLDERLIATREPDASPPMDGERFAVQETLPRAGAHQLYAVMTLLLPPASGAERGLAAPRESWLRSATLEFDLGPPEPAWLVAQADDRARNLVPEARARARASSSLVGRAPLPEGPYDPQFAIDGRAQTHWLAAADDKRPSLRIDFAEPPLADTILVGHAGVLPRREGVFAKALEVVVVVNEQDEHVLRMYVDEGRKGRLVLAEPIRVRSLELRIPLRVPGSGLPGSEEGRRVGALVGISEVELQLAAK